MTAYFGLLITYTMKYLVGNLWYRYVFSSFTLGAISLFILFAKMKISATTKLFHWIILISSTTLGLYLTHLHPLLVKFVIRSFAESFVNTLIYLYPLLIIGMSMMIYTFAFLMEQSRLQLFKWLQVHRLWQLLDEKMSFE